MNVKHALSAAVLALAGAHLVAAQEPEDRTLLDWTQMRAIVNEASGDRALRHVLEFVPWPRIRPASEYRSNFRESVEMVRFAKEYGYDVAEVETFPTQQPLTQAIVGELWMVEPEVRKLYDIHDVALALGGGGASGDVTGELVDVGWGGSQAFAGKDFRGKFVLRSGGGGNLAQLAPGLAGAINYSTLRADDQPDMIMSGGGGGPGTVNWNVAPRVGRELATRLAQGQKIVLKSVIKTEQYPGELEVVHLRINGDGSSSQEVILSCHLYEGYIKQGANDDASGCGLILEVGRAYIRLVAQGKLPRPRRTIHFIGGAEISGTNAWLNAHPEVATQLIADLNYDMDGMWLSKGGGYWTILRTPDTFPSFLNDLVQSFVEFVGNTNRERIRFRSNGYGFSLPIVSPNGSHDPLYYVIDKYYGASDHAVFLGRGVPAIMFNTWPDTWYHSSMDTPDKLDPTMFKRAAVVSVGAMAVLASADDAMALKVAGENLARGTERMGQSQRKGLRYLTEATDGPTLTQGYKEARNAVRHQAGIEKQVVQSAKVLFPDTAAGGRQLATFSALIDQRAAALQNELGAAYRLRATQLRVTPAEPVMTAAEQDAARLVVSRPPQQGPGGGGGGFGGFANNPNIPPADRQALAEATARIPQHVRGEIGQLAGKGGKSAMEIRDFVAGEFEPLPLADLMAFFRAQEKVGLAKLTERPAAAAARRR
ncbi:MAG: M28 family peptidase [Gemmatimonadetes bacterium]|nr:M28 family peptidase [Gemmatimonadota bacterium]